ncbi:hypothetical protein ACQYIJ_000657 [Enterobacter cloacae]
MKTFTIGWLNKCRCGNKSHTVKTARGNETALWDDDTVKCNSCGRGGVIQVCEGQARVLWETDEEVAENKPMSTITREFTKEQLIEQGREVVENIEFTMKAYPGGATDSARMNQELIKIALASLEAEPVAYVDPFAFNNFSVYRAGDTDNKRMGREWMWANPDAGLIPVYTAPPVPVSVPEWTNKQCLEFLSIAFRHAEINGDLQLDDIRLGVKMVNGSRAAMLKEENATKWWHGLYNEIKGRGQHHEGDFAPDLSMSTEEIIDAINKHRDAMLQGAEPVTTTYKLPMQPLVIDSHGTLRFKENPIVRKLLDYATEHGYGLNEIARDELEAEDQMQLAQLIGYSLSGYGTLSYVTDESYDRAAAAAPQQEVK